MNKLFGWLFLDTDEQLRTYGDVSRKEDVLGLVEILTSKETYFLNNLGKTTATDMVHVTLTDTLRTAASAAVGEAGDYTNLPRTTPSRLTNVIEIIAIPYAVSRSQQQIKKHTGENELARQTTKALMDWGNAAEFDLVRSTWASGASGTTPTMSKGLTQSPREYIIEIIRNFIIYLCVRQRNEFLGIKEKVNMVGEFVKVVKRNFTQQIQIRFIAFENVGGNIIQSGIKERN